jgi:hypothetical protein
MNPAVAKENQDTLHHALLGLLTLVVGVVVGWAAWKGLDYYRLPLTERPFHELHKELRPAGTTGIRLGMLSGLAFFGLFLYPLRKRWRWLGRKGKTKHWLQVHILLGLSVPLLVTLHSSFKLKGIAGMAYWIMMAIVASGIAGRYLYAQIPRKKTAAEISLSELDQLAEQGGEELRRQNLVEEGEWRDLLAMPSRDAVEGMPLWKAMARMMVEDVRRPFRVAKLRRQVLARQGGSLSGGGFWRSGNPELEHVISLARRQAWLTAKIRFLGRTNEIFRLWHVVHRPFSYSFAILVTAHMTLVMLMGYF